MYDSRGRLIEALCCFCIYGKNHVRDFYFLPKADTLVAKESDGRRLYCNLVSPNEVKIYECGRNIRSVAVLILNNTEWYFVDSKCPHVSYLVENS